MMITFMKKMLSNNAANNSNNNNIDRTVDSRSNTSSSSSSPFLPPTSDHHNHHLHCPYDNDDYCYYPDASKNRPQPCVLQASMQASIQASIAITAVPNESKCPTKGTSRSPLMEEADACNTAEANSLSASKTSNSCPGNRQNPSNDESVKENRSGGSNFVQVNRRSPLLSSSPPLYDSSPTMTRGVNGGVQGGGVQATSPDVCCCALCNKARHERRRAATRNEADKPKTSMSNKNDNNSNINNPVVGLDNKLQRTLREIPFKPNGSNEAYDNSEDDDDGGGGHVRNSNNSFSANHRLESFVEHLREKHLESTNSLTIRARSSTFSLSKFDFASTSSTIIRKYSTPPIEPLKTSPLTSFDPLNLPQSPHSPLSLPDGEEGNDIYRQRLSWLNSPLHKDVTSADFKPPNVTIQHVEEVRFSPNSARSGGHVVSGLSI